MRVMRLLVMFDLPTGSKAERRSYAEFRKFLVKDGYHMEQFSIYSRLLLTRESSTAHVERLRCNLPPAGVVTVLELTEKQYSSRLRLLNTNPPTSSHDEQGAQLTLVL